MPLTGIGTYIRTITRFIDIEKFETFLIGSCENIPPITDGSNKEIKSYKVLFKRNISPINDLIVTIKVFLYLVKENPHIIHAHSSKSGFIGRFAAMILMKKIFYTPNAFSYLSGDSKLKKKGLLLMERIASKWGSTLLACSESEFERGVKEVGYPCKRAVVWENSIPDPIIKKGFTTQINLPKEFILSIGRPSYQKNTEMMVEAIDALKQRGKNLNLIILGVGFHSPNLDRVRGLIRKYDLESQISLIDFIEREEALCVTNKALFYISSSRYEGLPFSILEAMAFEKAVIATDVDGNKDCVVNGLNGYLVSLEDVGTMADRIDNLWHNDKLREKFGKEGRKIFLQKFEITKTIPKLEEIYSRAVKHLAH